MIIGFCCNISCTIDRYTSSKPFCSVAMLSHHIDLFVKFQFLFIPLESLFYYFVLVCFQADMSHENSDLCNNPFVALFGSINQVELYKTSVKDATKTGMYVNLSGPH